MLLIMTSSYVDNFYETKFQAVYVLPNRIFSGPLDGFYISKNYRVGGFLWLVYNKTFNRHKFRDFYLCYENSPNTNNIPHLGAYILLDKDFVDQRCPSSVNIKLLSIDQNNKEIEKV